jgi:hypothetical protein
MLNRVWLGTTDVRQNADPQRTGALQAAEKVLCRYLVGKQNHEGQNHAAIMLPSFCPPSFCSHSDFGDVRAFRQASLQRAVR